MFLNQQTMNQNPKNCEMSKGPIKELIPLCRRMAAEGSVLLKNNGVLPFKKNQRIALFGRTQETYIKSGTGSGGLVRVEKVPVILDALQEKGFFQIDQELIAVYKEWILQNPYDNGCGWATEPWSQKEMPLTDELVVRVAERNDVALVFIGRTAGEDRDNSIEAGSYKLSEEELQMIEKVSNNFKETVVVLNVGNLIDLSFMQIYNISAVLYIWQGGGEGANALADMLSGEISPCGKLPDTQVKNVENHPCFKNFGNRDECIYEEDIYVGYRYFETFAKDEVMFPFGFGLTYTSFETSYSARKEGEKIVVVATVKNTGDFASKEVIQVYFGAPCGKLGRPDKELIAYKKTKELQPGETEQLELSFCISDMKSYDDSGVTGNEFCYVLEQGEYKIYAGTDVRSSTEVFRFDLEENVVVEELEQIMPPEQNFKRFVAELNTIGEKILQKKDTPVRKSDVDKRIGERRPEEIPFEGDNGIQLVDVFNGKNTLSEFIAQMTDADLASIVCGEGMDSPKVTVGTGGAFGGVTDSLLNKGIPVCCVTDGPSGIRIGGDYKSTSLPNGYVFASSFDDEFVEQIFEYEGMELYGYNIDALLGPGMNIHRHPFCGRNFEYFSEDPLLSGKIAAAQTRGVAKSGCTTTIKHFACNNQEYGRTKCNVVVSERALRDIYLKGFEIAVKEGHATAIMTSYNPVNNYWSASNYDLTTTVLRNEWGFQGFVMTDWWAGCNCKGTAAGQENLKAMVRAHNDVYMVCESTEDKVHNIFEGLQEGYITRGDLQYCAGNLLKYIMKSPTFKKFVDNGCKKPIFSRLDDNVLETKMTIENVVSGEEYKFVYEEEKLCVFEFEIICEGDILAQYPIVLKHGDVSVVSMSVSANNTGKIIRQVKSSSRKDCFVFEFCDKVAIKKFTIKQ